MKRTFKAIIILIIVTLLFANLSYAGPFKKLGRGLANMVTGWIELPVTVHRTSERHNYIGGLFYGIPIGLAKALIRTFGGVYEIVTFPFPIPEDYEPIIEPEFVMGHFLEKTRPEPY